ncbi:MAG: response regulator, partial [Gemmatimonadetes bacterium]|nr:response regulator [Gemmatimonadota bacterium]
ILCVDDEPNVLQGLRRHLGMHFDVTTAESGEEALKIMQTDGPFPVIVSDMRMPGMNGAELFECVLEAAPDTIKIMLTGHADLDAAISVVNEGRVFRFLLKPCPQETLRGALEDAFEHYRLRNAERELLEKTLQGSIKVLSDMMALVQPELFGRANRLQGHVRAILREMGEESTWAEEIAASLSQIGCVSLPLEVTRKLYYAESMTEEEEQQVARLPETTDGLLANIPRLEPVRQILKECAGLFEAGKGHDSDGAGDVTTGALVLKLAWDFDVFETKLRDPRAALDGIRETELHAREHVEALSTVVEGRKSQIESMTLDQLETGLMLHEDLLADNGLLLIARGQEITESVLSRIQGYAKRHGVREPILTVLPHGAAAVH